MLLQYDSRGTLSIDDFLHLFVVNKLNLRHNYLVMSKYVIRFLFNKWYI